MSHTLTKRLRALLDKLTRQEMKLSLIHECLRSQQVDLPTSMNEYEY